MSHSAPSQTLLAVDLGIRSGLALYNQDGRLRWYRSKNFGNTAQLRRGVRTILGELPDLAWLILEGGGDLAEIWQREAEYRDQFANPYIAEARGYIDDVIDPRETRPRLINALDMLRNKRDSNPPKKHGNIPL